MTSPSPPAIKTPKPKVPEPPPPAAPETPPPEPPPEQQQTPDEQNMRLQKALVVGIVLGAAVIAAIGFAGSFSAVRDLAVRKGFGAFAPFFPIGVDAGILVLLALDLLLTWKRIPFPLLRQTAWLLTAATIAFNGAAAWPDPLGVGMHAVIPVLFIVAVEAARHAIGRIADITADKHMEGVRVSRWFLAFPSTFRLWRRMKLWELRSYDYVVRLEQDRLVYQARLRARYGRNWRRKAPVESMTPLRLAAYGVPLAETGPEGLKAAGIDGTSVGFFVDPEEDTGRTTVARTTELSAPADNDPNALSSHPDNGADNGADNRTGRPHLSPRTSAPASTGTDNVRPDSGGQPQHAGNGQRKASSGNGVVPPASVSRPSLVQPRSSSSSPDKTKADNGADNERNKKADKFTPDNAGADNEADKKPIAADNAGADKLPRGALTEGVRAQLNAGVTKKKDIVAHLSQQLGVPVDPDNVGRILRRERRGQQPVQEPPEARGPYL